MSDRMPGRGAGRPGPGAGQRTLRLAHRGDHRAAPENTLAALRAALAVPGCDGLEFDVRLSHDRVPVLLHDETLARVQGRPGRAADLTAAELAAFGVPTLADVLANVPGTAFLDVELKVDVGAVVVEVLRAGRGPQLASAVVSSFEPSALASVRMLEPTWPCWLNADEPSPATLAIARELGCRGVSVEWRAIDEPGLERARTAGLEVAAWTVTDPGVYERLARLGVAAVCVEGAALEPDGTPDSRRRSSRS